MKSKRISNTADKMFAIVFERGDEVMSGLLSFAEQNHVVAGQFTAIGSFSDVTLGYFQWDKKEFKRIPIQEQVEVLSLVGDIAMDTGRPIVHAHVVVGKPDGSAHGGHLLEAHVRPTLEVILTEPPGHLHKTYDPETGLLLIDPGLK